MNGLNIKPLHNSDYGTIAKFFHWLIAVLIITNFLIGLTLKACDWCPLHKQIGLTILVLVILRIFWRLSSGYPLPISQLTSLEKFAAKIIHLILYVLMLLLPLSGILLVEAHGHPLWLWNLIQLPQVISLQPNTIGNLIFQWHKYLAYTIIVLVVFHGLAALKHHFINKDRVLLRMLPGASKLGKQ